MSIYQIDLFVSSGLKVVVVVIAILGVFVLIVVAVVLVPSFVDMHGAKL